LRRSVGSVLPQFDVEFCKTLSAKEGVTYRLPTEAEWEYACRAGSETAYSFGDDEMQLGDYAWYFRNSDRKAHPVGEKKPNAWGLYDMHGNVEEWCGDWYDKDYYANSPTTDPTGPVTGEYRVRRGGSWDSGTLRCESPVRSHWEPSATTDTVGFRIVLQAPRGKLTPAEIEALDQVIAILVKGELGPSEVDVASKHIGTIRALDPALAKEFEDLFRNVESGAQGFLVRVKSVDLATKIKALKSK
jgi:hypothetical protein